MSDMESLFGDEPSTPPSPTATPAAESGSIADWQVEQLRRALDNHGTADMAERQAVVEGIVGRAVVSLRALTSAEGRAIAEVLAKRSAKSTATSSSSWDDREEDTWIDRL